MTAAGRAGFAYVWRYRVRPGCEGRFERLYGPAGDWARLFGESDDYLGTDLLRGSAGEYLTIDRWTSRAAHAAFVEERAREFAALDARGETLTDEEERLGDFEPVPPEGG